MGDFIILYKTQSSAKRRTDDLIFSGRSFIPRPILGGHHIGPGLDLRLDYSIPLLYKISTTRYTYLIDNLRTVHRQKRTIFKSEIQHLCNRFNGLSHQYQSQTYAEISTMLSHCRNTTFRQFTDTIFIQDIYHKIHVSHRQFEDSSPTKANYL